MRIRPTLALATLALATTGFGVAAQAGEDELDRGIFKVLYSREVGRSVSTPIPFARILANPLNYLNTYVRTWVRFHREESLETPEYTPFNREKYMNFSVWDADAKLWEEAVRLADMPFCFVEKDDRLTYEVAQLQKYDLLLVYGKVHTVFLGRPWIEVIRIERASKATLTDAVLTHISVGEAFQKDGMVRHAIDEYDRVLQYNIMDDLAGEMWKRKGRNYLDESVHDTEKAIYSLDKARNYRPADPEVHLWYADALARATKFHEALRAARESLRLKGRQARAYALIGLCWREVVITQMENLGIRVTEKAIDERRKRMESVRPRDRLRVGVSLAAERVETHYAIGDKTKNDLRADLETALREGQKAVQLDPEDAEAGKWLEATKSVLADFDAGR